VNAGKKPKLAMVGTRPVTDGLLTETGRYLLVIDGLLYEVKPDFVLYAQWDSAIPSPKPSKDK
jgi:hypothetical protein